jgi:hypothetical protein
MRGEEGRMAINTASVIKGGLVAGLIINISETILNIPVLGTRMDEELAARNLPPFNPAMIGVFVVMCFALGVFLVWLYAAIRPRMGPGPSTAICAGLIVWGLAWLWPSIGMGVMGIYSLGLITLTVMWGLGEVLIASVAGAYFYREP